MSFLGRGYVVGLQLICIPVLLRLLGAETLGMLGLLAILQNALFVLDTGLSGVVSRELGKSFVHREMLAEIRANVYAIGRTYLATAGVIGVVACLLGLGFVYSWNKDATGLSDESLATCVVLLAIALSAQWMIGFNSAVLFGIHQASTAAAVNAVLWTLRLPIGIVIAVVLGDSPIAFFSWYAAASVFVTALAFVLVRKRLGASSEVRRSSAGVLRELARPIIAVSSVSIVLMIVNQLDKFVFAARFSLEDFGYYSLIWQIAGALYIVYGPIYNVYLPILSGHVSAGRMAAVRSSVSDGVFSTTLILVPVVVSMIFLSEALLFAWTGSTEAANRASLWLSLALSGAFIGSVLFVPYAAQQALERTDLTLRPALLILVAMAIAMSVASVSTNPTMVVTSWALCTTGLVLLAVSATLRVIGIEDRLRWWWDHVALPVLISSVVALVVREAYLEELLEGRTVAIAALCVTAGISAIAGAVSSARSRTFMRTWFISRVWS